MEVMWRIVLAVGLLCWGSDGDISCINEAGVSVDWYILYKKPNSFEFIHIDSTTTAGFQKSTKRIDHQDGVLAKTLTPIFTDTLTCPTCGYIAYNDQPPPGKPSAKEKCGHSKGIVMVDKNTVVWLLHSTPKFPETRESNKFFPESGGKKAQTFICVTFPVSELHKLETHLQNIRANIFEYANTDKFSVDIENFPNVWTSDEDLNKKTQLYQDLTSKDKKEFKGFFKKTRGDAKGDLYVTIADTLETNLYAQTWGGQAQRRKSYCPKTGKRVYNIKSVKSDSLDVEWNCDSDHSKWCVSEDVDWTCIADSNRAVSQFKRPGGALCISDSGVKNAFKNLKGEHEGCKGEGKKRKTSSASTDPDPEKKAKCEPE